MILASQIEVFYAHKGLLDLNMFYNWHKWYHCIQNHAKLCQITHLRKLFALTICFPRGILALSKKLFSSPTGILASLKEIIRYPKEKWLLIRFWDRHTANWTLHCTEFFANKFSKMRRQLHLILTSKCDLNFLFHPPVNSVKQLESFDSTWLWQIKEFSGDHMLILSNIRGH